MSPTREEVDRVAARADVYQFEDKDGATNIGAFIRTIAAENAALRKRLEAAEACNRGLVRLNEATEARAKDLQAALTEARAREAAAWDAAARVADHYAEMDYCAMGYPEDGGIAASGTADTIRRDIRAAAPTDATAALTAVKDAEWNAAIEAAADTSKDVGKPFARAFVLRRLSGSGYNVGFRAKQRVCVQIARRIRALRRNPKEPAP